MDKSKEDDMDSSEFLPERKESSISLPLSQHKKERPKDTVSEFDKLIAKEEHKQLIIQKILQISRSTLYAKKSEYYKKTV